ncbi:uncharacterized protein LOC132733476 [Ruditapes philippinarum]|uniref:uncharacterized protein LOC132733476 n=1 Tax=Ruditapes philippinarum TaxID=129788 RepID=UPI00295B9644|nr:uncharacterized protein LOC132733476 [Ruditapes philippinarum]
MESTDMDPVILAMILFLCTTSSVAINLPQGVKVKCPARYHVQAMSDRSVELLVVDNKTECERLMSGKNTKRTNEKDVIPSVTSVYTDGGYKANISWQFMQTGRRLPRVFLINLTFYQIESYPFQYISDTCVVLRLTGSRKVKTQGLAKFYFDCLPLLDKPDVGLVVQLWSYSRPGRLCRSLVSLSTRTGVHMCACIVVRYTIANVTNIFANIHIFTKRDFPHLFTDDHSYEYCACHISHRGKPKLSWEYDYSEHIFLINFTNVPPYLQSASIDISETHPKDRHIEEIEVRPFDVKDGEIHTRSHKFSAENYKVYLRVMITLYLKCEEPGPYESVYKQEISDRCDAGNDYFVYTSQSLNVSKIQPKKPPSKEQELWDSRKLQVILGVLGGIFVTVAVTGVTFYRCKKRKHERSRSEFLPSMGDTEMVDFSGRRFSVINNEQETHMTGEDNDIDLSSSRLHETYKNIHYQEMENLLKTHRATPNNSKGNITVSGRPPDNINETGHFVEEYSHESNVTNSLNGNGKVASVKETHEVLLIDISDANNIQHIQKVAKLEHILLNNLDIIIERGSTGNIYEFAELAFERYCNVVIIMSEELAEMCHEFRNADEIMSEELLTTRNRDIQQCIVLATMERLINSQILMQRDIKPLIYIVCLDNSRVTKQALVLFANDHPFLYTGNTSVHIICVSDLTSDEISPPCINIINSLQPSVRSGMPLDLQMKIMELNKDSESLNSELEESL